jgi:protein-L-isoaspartate(D-aspartate) O-methyltransferase
MPRYALVLLMVLPFFSRDAAPADDYRAARERMVRDQIEDRAVRDPRVLESMRKTPRHRFVPEADAPHAYGDHPLPIGEGQTISQPYIVALMTELARPRPSDKALEVGTGSGYQAAVLAPLVKHVYTIELEPTLGARAAKVLRDLGYKNVTTRVGDGYAGWPEEAPFDIVIVTAAPEHVPDALVEQLAPGGRLVVPVGPMYAAQELQVIEKDATGKLTTRSVSPVRFVPLRRKPED